MKKNLFFYVSVYLIVLSIAIFFRLYPLTSYSAGDAHEKASLYIVRQIRQSINKHVAEKYPDIKEPANKILEKKLFDEYLHKNGIQVRERIDEFSRKISREDPKARNYPYFLASDSYYYLSLTQNVLETGTISPTIRGSKYLNEKMLAPLGFWEPFNLHPYLGAAFYKFLKLFSPSLDLMYALSFMPLVLTAIILLIFVIFCHHLQFSLLTTFVGSTYFILAPIFLKRSMFAWYDNDPYNILFPLLVFYLYLLSLANKKLKSSLLLMGFLIGGLALYAQFWQGWLFIFVILLASLSLISIFDLLRKDTPSLLKHTKLLGLLGFGSFVVVAAIFGVKDFFALFNDGLAALENFLMPQLSPWPDLYINVGELHDSSLSFIIEQLGGIFFFLTAISGFIYGFWRDKTKEKAFPITIILFAVATFYITLGAQRFVLLMVIPFSLAFALGIEAFYKGAEFLFKKYLTTNLPAIRIAKIITTIVLLSSISFPMIWLNKSIRTLLNPIFNQTWEEALLEIKQKTPKDSIINTWWAPGHFIKAIARRRVIFDGASINVPQAYWIANIFLSESEEEALGILRMINTSGNQASEHFQSLGLDLSTSVLAIKDIVKRPRQQASPLLLGVFKNYVKTNQLLDLTHGKPAASYIFLYNEFVENNLQLKFIGDWNFKAIEEINKDPKKLRSIPKRNSDEYIQFLWKLAGGAYKYSGLLPLISQDDSQMIFQENVTVETKSLLTYVNSEKYGKGVPASIFFLKDGTLFEKKIPGANLSYSVMLIEKAGAKNILLLDRPLAQSLLIKLYFYEGVGLKYIKPFIHKRDLTGRTEIYVFEIDWEGFIKSLGD